MASGNRTVPIELQEELAQLFPGLSIEEALQHQESLYESLKTSNNVRQTARSSHNDPSCSRSMGHSPGESSLSFDMALDEALAQSLLELDMNDLSDATYFETAQNSPDNSGGNTSDVAEDTHASEIEEVGINPDEMSYEQLQSLGDSIGSESKGLSEREVSSLPKSKRNPLLALFFWKKAKTGQ
ncbi:hypothetical protein RND81_12G115900 [Saponaria officinalis]